METENAPEFVIASESVAVEALGFQVLRDVAPGEAILVTMGGELISSNARPIPASRPAFSSMSISPARIR
jgi:amidophosphoribosyltransferase